MHGSTESSKRHSCLSNIANVCVNVHINIILKKNILMIRANDQSGFFVSWINTCQVLTPTLLKIKLVRDSENSL